MDSKLLGGILLIVGTSIGGGMLALPVATAPGGLLGAIFLLLACWIVMTFSAFLILEVNLWLPTNSNMISMAQATLGKPGQIAAWFTYLLLHYSLLAAYIAGGTDMLHNLFAMQHIQTPLWIDSLLFVLVFGFIVYKGIQSIDYVNRGLMLAKLVTYTLLVTAIFPLINHRNLIGGEPKRLLGIVTVIITSFGFAAIVPSLRSYYGSNIRQLRLVILMGSFIPLLCYILWIIAILGALPRTGNPGLLEMLTSGHSNSDLIQAINHYIRHPWIGLLAQLFTALCVATSFLGVSLCLSDFLADGFRLYKQHNRKDIGLYLLIFLPPLAVIIFYPNAFIIGLNYAGICCTLLLILLPVLMAWYGRYHKKMTERKTSVIDKFNLLFIGTIAILIVALSLAENLGFGL